MVGHRRGINHPRLVLVGDAHPTLTFKLPSKKRGRGCVEEISLRVQVCNLNLEVYVFLGVVTVQLGIICSNYKVQVANLNPPDW